MSDKPEYLASMPDLDDQLSWQKFVMAKNYELAESLDPTLSGKALEHLARCSPVGLMEERIRVDVNQLSAEDLHKRLHALVGRILSNVKDESPRALEGNARQDDVAAE